jgi:hemerythrin-like domain-containing protein
MKSPTDLLRDDHRVILAALTTLEAAAARLETGAPLPEGLWAGLVDWLREFADRTHHAREEDALFPAMIAAGLPAVGGPIDVMLEEHVEGRSLVAAMAAGPPAARAAAARRYVQLLRAHIDKENEILFPLADAVLDEAAQAALLREFTRGEPGAATREGAEDRAGRFAAALTAAG